MADRRAIGINVGEEVENSSKLNKLGVRINGGEVGWKIVEKLIAGWELRNNLFDKLKSNTKKLKCFGSLSLF